MNKIAVTLIVVGCIGLIGGYLYMNTSQTPKEEVVQNSSPKNATYNIEGKLVTLVNGIAIEEAVPGSATELVTEYFGNEVMADLNGDGSEDVVFLLTQSTGGTGTFFYVVAALNTEAGWQGSGGFLLGDRISPQTTELSQNPSHQNVIVVNYAELGPDQAMTEQPTMSKSVWLKLDTQSMSFGEVEQNFEDEADPNMISLEMKTWTWVKTTYSNDTEVTPKQAEAFTLTFAEDNSVAIATDCNQMGGNYELNRNQISFGPLIATKMFCEGSQEQEFAKMLDETEAYLFTSKGELVLELELDSGLVMFK